MHLARIAPAAPLAMAAVALTACDKTPDTPAATKAGTSSATLQPMPAAFDSAPRVIYTQGYKLAC